MSKVMIAFRGLGDVFDDTSFKMWADKHDYTTKVFNFEEIGGAIDYAKSLDKDTQLEILGFSKGAESAYELAESLPDRKIRRLITVGTYWSVTRSFAEDGKRPPLKNVEEHRNYVETFQQPNHFHDNPINVSLGVCKHLDALRKALNLAPKTITVAEVIALNKAATETEKNLIAANVVANAATAAAITVVVPVVNVTPVTIINVAASPVMTSILPANVFDLPVSTGMFTTPAARITNTASPGVVIVEVPKPYPTRFFLDCNNGIPPLRVKKIVDSYGKDVLIGIDPGSSDVPDEDAMLTIKSVKSVGAMLHVYLVGPGMMSWSEEERRQIAAFAESVGIDLKKSNWHDEWKQTGWKVKNLQQFNYYWKEHNAYSCEIDNIDSSYIENDPDLTVEFYNDLRTQLKAKGIGTKLMMKNLDEDQLQAVIDAKFGLDFLCEFAMFEEGSGDPKKQIRLCEKLLVQAVTPINGITETTAYGTVPEGVPYNVKR